MTYEELMAVEQWQEEQVKERDREARLILATHFPYPQFDED